MKFGQTTSVNATFPLNHLQHRDTKIRNPTLKTRRSWDTVGDKRRQIVLLCWVHVVKIIFKHLHSLILSKLVCVHSFMFLIQNSRNHHVTAGESGTLPECTGVTNIYLVASFYVCFFSSSLFHVSSFTPATSDFLPWTCSDQRCLWFLSVTCHMLQYKKKITRIIKTTHMNNTTLMQFQIQNQWSSLTSSVFALSH